VVFTSRRWPLPRPPEGLAGLAAFIAVAYGGAFLLDYTVILGLLERGDPAAAALATPLLALRMLLPAAGAAAALKASGRSPVEVFEAFRLSRPRRWLPPSVALPLAAYTLSLPLAALAGLKLGPCGPLGEAAELLGAAGLAAAVAGILALAAVAGATVNAVFAAGEEAGWRWYLLGLLTPRIGLAPAGLLVGVAWSLWHAPLILAGYNYSVTVLEGCGEPSQGLEALAAFTVYTAAASLLLSALTVETGTAASAAVAHGTINAVAGLYSLLVEGPRILAPPAGLTVALALAAVTVAYHYASARLRGPAGVSP